MDEQRWMPLEAMWQEEKEKHMDKDEEDGPLTQEEQEEAARDFFMDMIDDMVEAGVMNKREVNGVEQIQLHGKTAALVTKGISFVTIMQRPEFWMAGPDVKMERIKEIRESVNGDSDQLTEEQKLEIKRIFRDPDVEAVVTDYFDSENWELNLS